AAIGAVVVVDDGHHLGHVHRQRVDVLRPRAGVPAGAAVDRPERLPDGAVALESGAERDLPHPVAAPDPPFRLAVGQLVPQRAARRVPEPVERHPRRLHVPRAQLQAPLQLVQHAAAPRVDAEVVERRGEVREVGLDAGGVAEHAAEHHRGEEPELLRQREHEGAQRRDVGAQRVAGDGHELLGQRHADVAGAVLLLRHARVAPVAGAAAVGAHRVHQLVLGAPPLGAPVGQEHRRAAHPEQRVGHQHRPVVAHVRVQRDVLRAHHQRVRLSVHLHEVLGEINGDDAGAAAHAAEVVGDDVVAEAVAVHDERGEGRRGAEEAGVDDDDADVGRRHAGLGEQLVDGAEDDGLRLLPRRAEAHVDGEREQRRREVGRLAEPRPLHHPPLERHALAGEVPREPEPADGLGARRLVRRRRLVPGEVHQVHRPRPRHGVRVRRRRAAPRHRHQRPRVLPRQRVQRRRGGAAGARRGEQQRDGEDARQVAADEAVVQRPSVVPRRLRHRPQQLPAVHCLTLPSSIGIE
ncbi:Os03g0162725, partial [Oryza sativa Japonica Group]